MLSVTHLHRMRLNTTLYSLTRYVQAVNNLESYVFTKNFQAQLFPEGRFVLSK